jgi:hypothetical protein
MDFTHRKLPIGAAERLRACPIETVHPYALMLAPVYVFMRRNEKFVSVKAPMDFFSPEELTRLRSFENFYLPEFVDSVIPFRDAARRVRAILSWKPREQALGEFPEVPLPPAPYELSDAVIRVIGPLWGADAVIEPFFVAAFANEFCDLLPGKVLAEARDRDVAGLERAVFRSSWAVFLALHLGLCELGFLNRLRRRVFDETALGAGGAEGRSEVDDLVALARDSFEDSGGAGTLRGDVFKDRGERVAQKIDSRLERVRRSFIRPDQPVPSIYGAKGFLDV